MPDVPTDLRTIAVLCASHNSVYKSLPGVDVYDYARDARTFQGGMPVVAHPPCRSWSAFCRHQAKPNPGEQQLGLWCVQQVVRYGGVLEQPAHSRLWEAAELPRPGDPPWNKTWALEVWQAWWGYPCKKATWLLLSRIAKVPEIPLVLHQRGRDRRTMRLMSHAQRSATCRAFAEWLLEAARTAH